MVDFEMTDQMRNIRDMAHWFAESEIRPIAAEADRTGEIPKEFLEKVMKMGISQGDVPKTAGGEGEGVGEDRDKRGKKQANRIAVIAAEEMAWGDPGIVLSFPGPGLGGPPVRFTGTPEQQKRFFGIFKDDEPRWGAYALTEPVAGSDVSAIETTAVKDGNHYVINGTKCFITNGARASWNVVFATVDKSQGRAGHRAFVIEKGTPGALPGKVEKKMGLRASETAELIYQDCRVPVENLLGGEEHYEAKAKGGFKTAMKTFDNTRPMVAGMAVGIARAAYEYTRDWFKTQYAADRPIPRYRVYAEMLANMAREIDAARLLCWHAGWMADEGLPNAKEASMCKTYAAKIAQWATINCITILGDSGTTRAHPVERWFRDIKVYDIFEGTGQVQQIVISRRIFQSMN